MTISGAPCGRPFSSPVLCPLGGGRRAGRRFLSIAPLARDKALFATGLRLLGRDVCEREHGPMSGLAQTEGISTGQRSPLLVRPTRELSPKLRMTSYEDFPI